MYRLIEGLPDVVDAPACLRPAVCLFFWQIQVQDLLCSAIGLINMYEPLDRTSATTEDISRVHGRPTAGLFSVTCSVSGLPSASALAWAVVDRRVICDTMWTCDAPVLEWSDEHEMLVCFKICRLTSS